MAEFERMLKEAGMQRMAVWEYVQRMREILCMKNTIALSSAPVPSSEPGGELFRGFSSISNRVGTLSFSWPT